MLGEWQSRQKEGLEVQFGPPTLSVNTGWDFPFVSFFLQLLQKLPRIHLEPKQRVWSWPELTSISAGLIAGVLTGLLQTVVLGGEWGSQGRRHSTSGDCNRTRYGVVGTEPMLKSGPSYQLALSSGLNCFAPLEF